MAHDMKNRRYLMNKSFLIRRSLMKGVWVAFVAVMLYKLVKKVNPSEYETEEEMNLASNPYTITTLMRRGFGIFAIFTEGKFNKTENKSVYLPKIEDTSSEKHPHDELKK